MANHFSLAVIGAKIFIRAVFTAMHAALVITYRGMFEGWIGQQTQSHHPNQLVYQSCLVKTDVDFIVRKGSNIVVVFTFYFLIIVYLKSISGQVAH